MNSSPAGQPSPERIQQFAFGYAPPLILEAALEHGVFDALVAGPKTLDTLLAETGASRRGLRALLDGLVGLKFLTRDSDAYALTPESEAFLVSSSPAFQGGMFRHVSRQLMRHWLNLSESVRTGQPSTSVNQEKLGAEFFAQFVEDLFPRNYPAAKRLAEELQIESKADEPRVLDLAAGSGVWSIPFAQRSPQVRATAVDWPEVIPVTRRIAEREGVGAQFRYIEGDLLEADFGEGYQAATLGHILHSEGEARSRQLLAKVFAALAPGGVIAIPEMLPDDDRTGPTHALIFALNMLVHTDEGDAYTFAEITVWLREAGFENVRLLEAPAPSPLILADKPDVR